VSLGSYLASVGLCVLAGTALVAGAVAMRRALLPGWTGAPARLAEAVMSIAAVLLAAELLGTFGALYRWSIVAALVVVGLFGVWVAGRLPSPQVPRALPAPPALSKVSLAAGLAVATLVVGQWAGFTLQSLHHGMLNVDTLWYHLPFGARFAETHSITALHFTMTEPLSATGTLTSQLTQSTIGVPTFYPANSSLLHAVGMLIARGDFFSPLINIAFLLLGLLAAWCIGRPFGAPGEALAGSALLLTVPAMLTTQPGQGTNDVVVVALLLAAAALLVNGGIDAPAPVAMAGLAAGLALGAKLNMLAPIGVLTIGLLVARGARLPRTGAWLGGLVATGGYWFVRNFADAGNPIPYLHLPLLPRPDLPLTNHYAYPAVRYLTDESVWRTVFRPQLHAQFGPVWWALLALGIGGMALAVVRGGTVARLLGLAALGAVIAFPFTPLTGAGPRGYPYLFAYTLRYLVPALALGVILLTSVLRGKARLAALVTLVVVFVITETASPWAHGLTGQGLALALAVLAAGGALARLRPRVGGPGRAWAIAAALVLAVIVGGAHEASVYRTGRYADRSLPLGPEVAWASEQRHVRVALAGFFVQFQFYGRDLSNHVQVVGRTGAHGAYFPIRSCSEWRRALAAGRYEYVVTASPSVQRYGAAALRRLHPPEPPEAGWTRSLPGTVTLMRSPGGVSLFRLGPTVDARGCPSTRQ
jgi:Dolichyl-phosphate-mannose-protein mannosyltransferase